MAETIKKKRKSHPKLTLEQLIERFNEIHNNKYDYSLITEYTGTKQYIDIICPTHGKFTMQVNHHLRGQGCKKCAGLDTMTTEKFLKLVKEIHGDKYDYSKSVCNGSHKSLIVICPKHGEFTIDPHHHIYAKRGCRKCADENNGLRCRHKQEDIIKRIQSLHPEWIFDENFQYVTHHTKVTIKCPLHGYFSTTPSHIFYMNSGCPDCNTSTLEEEVKNFLFHKDILFEQQKSFKWLKHIVTFFNENY